MPYHDILELYDDEYEVTEDRMGLEELDEFKGILAGLGDVALGRLRPLKDVEVDLAAIAPICTDYYPEEETMLKKSEEQFELLIAEPETPETIEEFEEGGISDDYLNDLYDDADFAIADSALTIYSVGDEVFTTHFGSKVAIRGLAAAANDIFKASL